MYNEFENWRMWWRKTKSNFLEDMWISRCGSLSSTTQTKRVRKIILLFYETVVWTHPEKYFETYFQAWYQDRHDLSKFKGNIKTLSRIRETRDLKFISTDWMSCRMKGEEVIWSITVQIKPYSLRTCKRLVPSVLHILNARGSKGYLSS